MSNEIKKPARIGKFSPKNKLNDLTGSEWVFFLKSVVTTAYSTRGAESYSHNLRKKHPSPKPPQLMKNIIEFFTKENQWILDPFAGVGGTLLGASLSNRKGLGIELNPEYISIYKQVCKNENLKEHFMIKGDSRQIEALFQKFKNSKKTIPSKFDLIITDPPYSNMMSKKRTVGEKNGKTSTPFTDSKKDIGNLELGEFLEELNLIIIKSLKYLKTKGYLIIFIKDMQPKKEHHNLLHADIVNKLCQIKNIQFRGYKIWLDNTQTLYPLGYPHAFVSNQFHQYILIFRKEI